MSELSRSLRSDLHREVVIVVIGYAVIAGLWIATSDTVLGAVVEDFDTLVWASKFKGFAFVGATAVLLFILLRAKARAIESAVDAVAQKETERLQHEEARRASEDRYRSTLDSIMEGGQLLSFDWEYLYLNDAAAVQSRRPNEELLGNRLPDMWPGIEETRLFELLRACMEERVRQHEEVEFTFPDGESGWFDLRAQPVPEGVFILTIDVTERHRAEVELRELNASLDVIVEQRTRDLDEARLRAESADRIKSSFLATMSHELRTPLNSIIGFTGILLQRLAGPLNEEQEKQLGMVQHSARHLLSLINDVLDISKIEAGQFEIVRARFDLRGLIERVGAVVRPLADQKGLTLRVEVAPEVGTIESDQRRVEQILLNLANNAIKFTESGNVSLTAELVNRGSAAVVRIGVADTGIGISQESIGELFQPFQQIDAGLQRQREGTGLGLAISCRLATMLGGRIAVDSELGEGSEFVVELPLCPDEDDA